MSTRREDPCDAEAVRRMFELSAAATGMSVQRWADLAQECWTEDVVYREDPLWPGAGRFEGREAVLARFLEYEGLIGQQSVELLDAVAGEQAVLALIDFTASGHASGARIRQRFAYAVWTRDGKVCEFHAYLDEAQPRAKAGL